MVHCAGVSFGVPVVIILVVVIVDTVLIYCGWKFFKTFIENLGTFL